MSRDFTPDADDLREGSAPPSAPSRLRHAPESPRENTRREVARMQRQSPVPRESRQKEVPPKEARSTLYDRHRSYTLRESEIQTLTNLGKFRVIAAEDLARHGYAGDRSRMEREIESLSQQGLVQQKNVEVSLSKTTRHYGLTNIGRKVVRQSGRLSKDQEIYAGFVKPREAKHDAELYRLYHKEEERIERQGGRVRRVLLDYELKKNVNRDLAQLGPQRDDSTKQREVAERHGLRVVQGHIPVPDLQIEYDLPEQGISRVNLELTTDDYRPSQLAAKAQAGFTLYSHGNDTSRLRRILDSRELTAEILSL